MGLPAWPGSHVEVEDVALSFGHRPVFDALNCAFPRGQISVVMGASGTGKSTLLRLIGGLQRPDRGCVRVAGEEIAGRGDAALSSIRKQLGMLFQNGALLDSMTIFENVALPLREHENLPEEEIVGRVRARLEAVGLPDVEELLPRALSGGMLRRAALARAIVMEPAIVLCDEPFSGLDPPNVTRIEGLLRDLNQNLGLTLIVTSHHMASSLRMADQIFLMRDRGCLSGSPLELAGSQDSEILEFIGEDGAEYLARHAPGGEGGR
ncbi:MAG: ATP-binding cassette domain-containing protein [Myxococcota bacterium]|nr:ATP-binding cassette domain-containing protein [Myxococcota bacterium]